MALAAGDRLGPYEIVGPLGAGGMGEIFRATDTRLGRSVAIKFSKGPFSSRFEREARAISALNHPHICTLYDVGPNYLVMELVEGESLAARLRRGPLPLDLAALHGIQIAAALAAAHEKGIVHRDLKPANIMVTKTGIKVLDFGLAKMAASPDETLTASNVVMGTPAYMAPEQVAGEECDVRTDIYAFGLVLLEMVTGKRLPAGQSPLLEQVPENFVQIIEGCVAPDPDQRWRSAHDIERILKWAVRRPAGVPARRWLAPLAWGIALLGIASLATLRITGWRQNAAPASFAQFDLSLEEQMAGGNGLNETPTPSPDGRYLVFTGSQHNGQTSLWIRALNSREAQRLPGTEGANDVVIWSPDSRWIGFYADRKLKKISPGGGPALSIAELPGFQDATWGPKGSILFRATNRAPLFLIRDSGGSPVQVTKLDASLTENSHRYPQFLPDGRRFLFTSRCGERAKNALYIGSLDSPSVKRVMPAQSRVIYVPATENAPGMLYFYRDGALVAQPFDADAEHTSGEAIPVIDRVAYVAPSIQAHFNVSADGRLIIVRTAGATLHRLTWFKRDGEEIGTVGPPGDYSQPRISPDGTRLLYSRPDDETGNRDLWSMDLARGTPSRLTVHPANDWYGVWSPDGRQILFGSDREGRTFLPPFLKRSMDPGSDESPLPHAPNEPPYDWSRDGRWVSLGTTDIEIASMSSDRKPFAFLATPFLEGNGRFSPDAKWIAYVSNESGRFEVYVRPFAGAPAAPNGKVQMSTDGGDFPVWGPTGQELFYMSADSEIYAVSTRDLGRNATAPVPSRLFRACPGTLALGAPTRGSLFSYSFDTHDGQRFLVTCAAERPGRFVVLTNWTSGK